MSGPSDFLPAESVGVPEDLPGLATSAAGVEAVVRPGSTEEVAAVLDWAGREGVRVLPVGTARHLPPGALASGCVVLLVDRLAEVEMYEPADLTLTAGAGLPMAELARTLAPHGQWLPFEPVDVERRTLGGLVATGASGAMAAGYGALRNHVLGATVVRGDGAVLRLGGRVVKNVAGFDLLRPVVGSRGSLAVITSVCVRVFPMPERDRALILRGETLVDLVHAARAVATAPLMPASSLLVSGAPGLGSRAALLVRLHGSEATVTADQATLERTVGRAFDAVEGSEALGVFRSVRDHPAGEVGVGVLTVLPDRLAAALAEIGGLGSTAVAADVHEGRIVFAFGPADAAGLAALRRRVEGLGGSLGLERLPSGAAFQPFVDARSVPSPGELALMERLRRVFDPAGALGGGEVAA